MGGVIAVPYPAPAEGAKCTRQIGLAGADKILIRLLLSETRAYQWHIIHPK